MIKNKFIIGKEISKGAYAVVRECFDNNNNKYACKIIKKERVSKNFYNNEVEISKLLSGNTNLVPKHIDESEDYERYYIIQEFCHDVVNYDSIAKECEIKDTIRKTLQGIVDIHESGVVHRDIKYTNLLKADGGIIKICDFGVAFKEETNNIRNTEKILGTPLFLAPEQLVMKCGKKSDVWSLGILAFFLMTGKYPFSCSTKKELFKSILQDEPNFNSVEVSLHCKDFIRICLEKGYDSRPCSKELMNHTWLNSSL